MVAMEIMILFIIEWQAAINPEKETYSIDTEQSWNVVILLLSSASVGNW